MNAQEIIRLLEEPVENGLPIKQKIIDEVPLAALMSAMQEPKTTDTYEILCEILGKRKEAQAVPCLIEALQDTHAGVRAEAAQALAKIGKRDAGEALLMQMCKRKLTKRKSGRSLLWVLSGIVPQFLT